MLLSSTMFVMFLLESGEVWGGNWNYIQPHSPACKIVYNAQHWI